MDNSSVVVLVEPNRVVKNRIRNILSNQQIRIFEVSDREDLLSVLSKHNYNVDLIITEIEINPNSKFDGISLIQLVKEKRSAIPVVILTSISKKDVITRCLAEGASDYILKPFEDEYLKEKLIKYINLQNLTELTTLKLNLMNFLEGEIYKARKGKYAFSLLKIVFDSNNEDQETPSQYAFYKFAEPLYAELKSLFWEADLYIQHGFQSHLGFFPFCNRENVKIIVSKILATFNTYKLANPRLDNYNISYSFVSYPEDGDMATDLLNKLD